MNNKGKIINNFKIFDEADGTQYNVDVIETDEGYYADVFGIDTGITFVIPFKDSAELLKTAIHLAISNEYLSDKLEDIVDILS